jgi:hypothetical protein
MQSNLSIQFIYTNNISLNIIFWINFILKYQHFDTEEKFSWNNICLHYKKYITSEIRIPLCCSHYRDTVFNSSGDCTFNLRRGLRFSLHTEYPVDMTYSYHNLSRPLPKYLTEFVINFKNSQELRNIHKLLMTNNSISKLRGKNNKI